MALLFATMLPSCYTLELSFLSASFDGSLLLTAGHSPSKTCLHLQSPVISTRQQFAQKDPTWSVQYVHVWHSLLITRVRIPTDFALFSFNQHTHPRAIFVCLSFLEYVKALFPLFSFSGGKRAYSPPSSISASTYYIFTRDYALFPVASSLLSDSSQYTPRSFWAFMTDRLPPIQYSSDIAAHFRNQACSECSCNLLCNIHVIHGDELRSASRRLCTGNHD
jgi:hypothetical protein